MNTATHWRKVGSAHMLADAYSTIYVKRIGRAFHLISRNPNPLQGGWLTLGVYSTLRDAKANGSALMQGEVG